MGKVVLGVLVGAGAIAAATAGGTYLSTGETWESMVLRKSSSRIKYGDGDTWTYGALGIPGEWKKYFECCCKDSASGCDGPGVDNNGHCPTNTKIWKVKSDQKDAIKKKCNEIGSRVDWAWNRNTENGEYTNYSQVCFKQKDS